jgi:hypothetical protein
MTEFEALRIAMHGQLYGELWPKPGKIVKLNPEFARRHHLGAVTRPQAEKRILNDARLAYDYRQRGRG